VALRAVAPEHLSVLKSIVLRGQAMELSRSVYWPIDSRNER
jgi:hypothetical protein